jgi:hypothetical protein
VERLLAVQGQDPRGARLAVRARTTGLTAADVDRGLTDRALLITWLNRGTLHLVRSEDYPWLLALTAPPILPRTIRRLAQERVSPDEADRAVAAIEQALADSGPLTRAGLRERVAAAGVRTEGQALVHIIGLASLRGLIVRGPMIGTASMGSRSYAIGSAYRQRSTATRHWPSWPAATSPATAPPATATSPGGRASRCATPARV